MRFEIRRRGVKVTKELRNYLKDRLQFALSRFGRHIDLIRVYLQDLNGPRGGMDKKCRIVVALPPRGRVVVSGADTGLHSAITETANRAGFAVRRHVKRRRTHRRLSRRPDPVAALAVAQDRIRGRRNRRPVNGDRANEPQRGTR
jgi:ribosome-associated translation inhibitor RaiA